MGDLKFLELKVEIFSVPGKVNVIDGGHIREHGSPEKIKTKFIFISFLFYVRPSDFLQSILDQTGMSLGASIMTW